MPKVDFKHIKNACQNQRMWCNMWYVLNTRTLKTLEVAKNGVQTYSNICQNQKMWLYFSGTTSLLS